MVFVPFTRDTVRSSYFSGVIWGLTEVVSAVKASGTVRIVLVVLCHPGVVMVGMVAGLRCLVHLCSAAGQSYSFHTPYVQRLTVAWRRGLWDFFFWGPAHRCRGGVSC